jgi:hypothetical protein
MNISVNGCKVELTDMGSILSYKKKVIRNIKILTLELKEEKEKLKKVEEFLKSKDNVANNKHDE